MKQHALYLINFILAFCSIGYEFTIARTLTEMTGRGSQAQALTVAFYILGLGIGANFAKAQESDIFRRLIKLEVTLALLGAISISAIQILHLVSYTHFLPDIQFLIGAQVISLTIGALSGAELPFLLSVTRQSLGEKSTLVLLGLNYLGAMLSSIVCIYVFFPAFSGSQIVWIFSLLNLFAALMLLLLLKGSKTKLLVFASGAAACLLVFGRWIPANDYKYLQYYYSMQVQVDAASSLRAKISALDESVGVERTRTPYQVIDFVKRRFPEAHNGRLAYRWEDFLYINGQLQILIGKDIIYHELMAHVPVSLVGNRPKNILILGGGDGLLARELFRQQAVESIKLVEIDPQMIHVASTRPSLVKENANVFADSKLTTVINDAYVFARTDTNKYDAVYIDLPFPYDEDLNKLYSYQFYANVLRLMKPTAFMVIDYPLDKGPRLREIIYHTLRKAGFENITGFGDKSTFVLATRPAVSLSQNANHPLLSEQSLRYSAVHSEIFSSIKYAPQKANSALRPLLVGH